MTDNIVFQTRTCASGVIKMTVKPSNMKGGKRENEGISRYFQGYVG